MGPLEPALAGEIGGFMSDPLGTVKLRPQVGIPTTILSLATPERINKIYFFEIDIILKPQ